MSKRNTAKRLTDFVNAVPKMVDTNEFKEHDRSIEAGAQVEMEVDESAPEFAKEPDRKTWSARIRELAKEGLSTSAIAKKITGERGRLMRYQHVRNVLKRPLKRVTMAAAQNTVVEPQVPSVVEVGADT